MRPECATSGWVGSSSAYCSTHAHKRVHPHTSTNRRTCPQPLAYILTQSLSPGGGARARRPPTPPPPPPHTHTHSPTHTSLSLPSPSRLQYGSFWDLAARQQELGVGQKFFRKIWQHHGEDQCYWTVTRTKPTPVCAIFSVFLSLRLCVCAVPFRFMVSLPLCGVCACVCVCARACVSSLEPMEMVSMI